MSTEEKNIPTKKEIMALLSEQIQVRTLQAELAELNERVAKAQAGEYQAMQFIANMKNPQPSGVPHTISQEDIDNNPELSEQGFKVGDEVLVPADDEDITPVKDRKLKKA